jgi:hypothetical protein
MSEDKQKMSDVLLDLDKIRTKVKMARTKLIAVESYVQGFVKPPKHVLDRLAKFRVEVFELETELVRLDNLVLAYLDNLFE